MNNFAIAIHGGAGTILKSLMTEKLEQQYSDALKEALNIGSNILKNNGSSLDAVEAAVASLEDYPLFNAGKGSVFNNAGKHEMDAAIMNGSDLSAGAVAGVFNIKNPVELAKAVMLNSGHVLLSGTGAETFAKEQGIKFEDDSYFFAQQRYDQWQEIKDENTFQLDHTVVKEKKFGTVGAVAIDLSGNLAAATSTGGMTNKKFGRIGDSAIIGAGTYANNKT
ncbi:MAG: isoaspartyl peptidase/L-asparaginase, partial [Bacteroidia bacterium]|nr:isoaspartyl peptidase/L-asparaginase [Bacteroidia bacterium]